MAFKGWKKVSDHKDHAVLRHESGHEMKVAKGGLTPKMRGQLAEIPVYSDKNNPKLSASKDKPGSKEAVAEDKGRLRLSSGGGAYTQEDKEAFSRGASGEKTTASPIHKVSTSSTESSHHQESEDPTETAIAKTQASNKADPSKADALEKTNAAREKYYGGPKKPNVNVMNQGGRVKLADGTPDAPIGEELAPGVPQDASNPQQFDFEQKKAQIAQSDMNYSTPEQANMAITSKALDQVDNEKVAGAQAAASVGADQGAAYQKAVDLNARLQAAGQAPMPLPPMPAGGAPKPGDAMAGGLPEASGSPQQPAAPGSDDPYGTGATQDAYMKGIGEQKAGIFGEARALGAQGNAEAKVAHDAAVNKQNLLDSYQNETANLNTQRQHFVEMMQNQKIDPGHYLGEMSTMGRIGNAIGLILGGMGAGVTGGKNPALEMLNSNIDRDIRAQEANLGTTKSLLEFNQQQFGNLREAKEMTRVMMTDVASQQLKEAAAKSQDPLAKARALQAAGQLDQTTAANVGQYAMRKTMLSGVKDGKVAPASFVEFALPKEERPAARKELADAQEAVKARDNILGSFDKIDKLQSVGSRVFSPIQSKQQIAALKGPLVAALSKATAGRFTEQDSAMLDPLFPDFKDDPGTKLQKRSALTRLINEKLNYPTLDAYHINPAKSGGRFNDQGQSRIPQSAPVPNKKR